MVTRSHVHQIAFFKLSQINGGPETFGQSIVRIYFNIATAQIRTPPQPVAVTTFSPPPQVRGASARLLGTTWQGKWKQITVKELKRDFKHRTFLHNCACQQEEAETFQLEGLQQKMKQTQPIYIACLCCCLAHTQACSHLGHVWIQMLKSKIKIILPVPPWQPPSSPCPIWSWP